LAASVRPKMRPLAIGIWGGVNGIGVAVGPLVSGAVVEGLSWQWIFWLNIPLGVIVLPFVWRTLRESYGPDREFDPLGVVLATVGVVAMVWAIIRSDSHGWSSTQTLVPLVAGAVLVMVFLAWQTRARTPLVPLRLFRIRAFSVINVATI